MIYPGFDLYPWVQSLSEGQIDVLGIIETCLKKPGIFNQQGVDIFNVTLKAMVDDACATNNLLPLPFLHLLHLVILRKNKDEDFIVFIDNKAFNKPFEIDWEKVLLAQEKMAKGHHHRKRTL